ncbi:MAG: NYN domain-containing protein [Alteraurantiacibacter sp.]
MRRVIVYIDGFNLYHAIDDLGQSHLKWLNLRALAESLLRTGEQVKLVRYFSAYATWKTDAYARHRDYVAALKAQGVETNMASFKKKPRRCFSCGAQWFGHEEKETDVNIAVQMVADALTGEVDRLILISADTDLAPPIRTIAQLAPQCEVFVATPPKRFKNCQALKPALEITAGRIAKCLLPAQVQVSATKTIARPQSYAPPP